MPRSTLCGAFCALILLLAPGCRSLSRDLNESLPEFLRSDPGRDQLEIVRSVRRARTYTETELARQKADLAEAEALLAAGQAEEAADAIELFLEEFPDAPLDEDARYLLIQAHDQDDEAAQTWNALREFGTRYPVSRRSPEVLALATELGNSYLRGDQSSFFGIFSNKDRGREILTWIVRSYPASPTAADAQWTLANDALDRASFEEAAQAFDFFVEQYPASPWIDRAHYLRAFTRWRQVKGVVYDPAMKREARRLFQGFLDRRSADEDLVQDATQKRDQLLEDEAQYYAEVGQWYLGQDRPFAARFYFTQVVTLFPTSRAAETVRPLITGEDEVLTAGAVGAQQNPEEAP